MMSMEDRADGRVVAVVWLGVWLLELCGAVPFGDGWFDEISFDENAK